MIGKKIQTLRKERGLSLSELAVKADIAKSYLSSIERDIQKNPSIQLLEKIAAVLSVPIQSLILKDNLAESLDQEWLELVQEAMEANVTKQEFKDFLEFTKWKQQQSK